MQLLGFSSATKNILILLFKTLSIYMILSVFFHGYVALVDSNGSYYSPFLAKYSLIQYILNSLIYPIVWILKLFGYDVIAYGNHLSIINERGISIYYACLGIDIIIAYVALVLGYPGRKKLIFLVIGICAIHLLNILRMLMILLTIKDNPDIAETAHDVFNFLGYSCILLLYFSWISRYSKNVNQTE